MLCEYNERENSETESALESAQEELDDVTRKIDKIVRFIMESDLSLETVKEEMKRLELKKRSLETQIREITFTSNTAILSEEMIIELINKSKECLTSRNIPECRKILSSYIDKVVAYRDKVKIFFKIHVPDNENTALSQLTSEEDRKTLQKGYGRTE
jgi:site-specific DNA recombinase